jgi:insertion element IS1 protein InsB
MWWGDSIECEEIWAFVGFKKNQRWVWLARSYQSGQTFSFALDDRDLATGKKLIADIPEDYKKSPSIRMVW